MAEVLADRHLLVRLRRDPIPKCAMRNGDGFTMTDVAGKNVLVIDTATDSVVTGGRDHYRVGVNVFAQRSISDHRRHAELLTTQMGRFSTNPVSAEAISRPSWSVAVPAPSPVCGSGWHSRCLRRRARAARLRSVLARRTSRAGVP